MRSDRAAARLGDVDDELGLERAAARALRQLDRKVGVALVVGLNLVFELVLDRGEFVIRQSGDIAREAGEGSARDRLQPNGPGHVKAVRRRAVKKPRVERKLDRLAGIDDQLGRMQGEVEPLGM